jgi:tetratricopeptide (TPR) repeat protein
VKLLERRAHLAVRAKDPEEVADLRLCIANLQSGESATKAYEEVQLQEIAGPLDAAKMLTRKKTEDLDSGYRLARTLYSQLQIEEALEQAKKIIDQAPGHRGARIIAASSLERMGRYPEAASQRRALADLSKSAADYRLVYRCECRGKNWVEALAVLDKISALSLPSNDIVEEKLKVLIKLGSKEPFIQAINSLAASDLSRALAVILVWAEQRDWRTAAHVVTTWETLGLRETRYGTSLGKLVKLLKRRAHLAARAKDPEEVADLRLCIANLQARKAQPAM